MTVHARLHATEGQTLAEARGGVPRLDVQDEVTDTAIARALGEELRRAREAGGWSRVQFVACLPSGIGDRTLLAYEHGIRHLTVIRLMELCQVVGVGAPTLLTLALQRARIHLENLALQVDLRELLNDESGTFRPMFQWARNRLTENPTGLVEVGPAAVRELAAFIGCSHRDLANYLAKFPPTCTPEPEAEEESSTDRHPWRR